MKKLQLITLWLGICFVTFRLTSALDIPFDPRVPRKNLHLLIYKKKPKPRDVYQERRFDEALASWRLSGPLDVALPPMYRDTTFGNAGFLSSFIDHGEVILHNGPYPHPKLSIVEKQRGGPNPSSYAFDNRASNAAMLVREGGETWPIGYSAWYDVVTDHRIVYVKTPYLLDGHNNRITPTSVRTTHPLNEVDMDNDLTRIDMQHWSPVVWTFPQEGQLGTTDVGYAMDAVADGAEVSYLPSLAERGERVLGLFLLAPLVGPTDSSAPRWWPLDERFRRAVLAGAPIAERRALLRQIAAAYPSHPMLAHYRVIAELGGDHFDDTWLRAQRAECQLSTWYLLPWTRLPLSTVRELPCLADLPSGKLNIRDEYIAEYTVLAYRAARDDEELRDLAARVIDASYLRKEIRGFNLPLSDFAWLWLKARP